MTSVEIEVPVRRGPRGLGVVVSPNNIILELAPGGTADEDKKLQVGDVVVGIDGHPLIDMHGMLSRLKDKLPELPKRPVHVFLVQRSAAAVRSKPAQVEAPAAPRALSDDGDDGSVSGSTLIASSRPAPSHVSSYASQLQSADWEHPVRRAPPASAPRRGGGGGGGGGGAKVGGASMEVQMILLSPEGDKYTQYLKPLSSLSSAKALIDVASEAWVAASQCALPGPLRLEAIRHNGERVLVTAATPLSSLRLVSKLHVSSHAAKLALRSLDRDAYDLAAAASPYSHQATAADGASAAGSARPAPRPRGDEAWQDEASSAAEAAVSRAAKAASTSSHVLQALLAELGGDAGEKPPRGDDGQTEAALRSEWAASAARRATAEATAAASSRMSTISAPGTTAVGEDVLPPGLLEALKPKLAAALQQSAALAVQAAEARAEEALEAALAECERKHTAQLDALMAAAEGAAGREREVAVERMLAETNKQHGDRLEMVVKRVRAEEAAQRELETEHAVAAAVQMAERKFETAKKVAIEGAVVAAEKKAVAQRERELKATAEQTAGQWRVAMRTERAAAEERSAKAMQRAERGEKEAVAKEAETETKLNAARKELFALKGKLEEAEEKVSRSNVRVHEAVTRRLAEEQREHKKRQDAAVMEALKAYERRAADEKAEAVRAAINEARVEAARERSSVRDEIERARLHNEAAVEAARTAGFKQGHKAAMEEVAVIEAKAAANSRAQAGLRMQERAQADVAAALAGAQLQASQYRESTAVRRTGISALAAEAGLPILPAGAPPVRVPAERSAPQPMPGVMEAVRAAEEAAKASTMSSNKAVLQAASEKWAGR